MQEVESGGQLLTVHTRTCAGRMNTRTEETKTAGAEPEDPSVPRNLRQRQEENK